MLLKNLFENIKYCINSWQASQLPFKYFVSKLSGGGRGMLVPADNNVVNAGGESS